MRSLPPIYIPTGCSVSEDVPDSSNGDSTDDDDSLDCYSLPTSPVRKNSFQEKVLFGNNTKHVDPQENIIVFSLSTGGIFIFKEIIQECTVEFARKRLELELGLPSDAFQLTSNDGKCLDETRGSSSLRLVDCAPKSVNFQIEIFPNLEKTCRLALEGNVNDILLSGTLDILGTPFLKSLSCADVISVAIQRAFLMMYLAANRGHFKIVDTILKKNIDPNMCTPFGRTPLHVASFHGRLDVVELLLSYGADVFHRDNDGKTPQEVSTSRGYTQCIRRLWLHRWNLRPPLMVPCQQNELWSNPSSPGHRHLRKTTSSKNATFGNSFVSMASDVVRLWPMENGGHRLHSPREKYPPFQKISQPPFPPWRNSKTRSKWNSYKLLCVSHHAANHDSRCKNTTTDTKHEFKRGTVSICSVVNLNSPYTLAEIVPRRNYESDSLSDTATKEEPTKNSQINQQKLMRKLRNVHRPVMTRDGIQTKTPPDFQMWLQKKNTKAKEEEVVELGRNEKTLKQQHERKKLSERAYKDWLSNKRRLVKPKSETEI
ncbi:uncharacterized protein LOC117123068 [Anneissia japonica]|uniref:uncharacterized protein LOC117123068 n=1 Tax=Anneissia japonica TaxID=1529436 RepID=UPI0014256D6C|nr:uncharacterized protein LOC117123068 [Anneissia japonica]